MSSRFLLLVTGILFTAFGLHGFVRPETVPNLRAFTLAVSAGPGELRAYYGDFELGFGLFLLYARTAPRLREAAHLAVGLTLLFVGIGRVAWVARGANPTLPLLASLLSEVALGSLNLYAFSRAKRLAPLA